MIYSQIKAEENIKLLNCRGLDRRSVLSSVIFSERVLKLPTSPFENLLGFLKIIFLKQIGMIILLSFALKAQLILLYKYNYC
jgi:hypothetical protein